MQKWIDVIRLATNGNLKPDQKLEKTEEEWKNILTDEQFYVTRKKGTERANSSEMCTLFEPGRYACICCETELFDSGEKFQSGTGWPSFTQPIKENVINYIKDRSHGMYRIETTCSTCDAHLGHVFQDGPLPSGLRFCINAEALKKTKSEEKKITFGGGCFWCTEAIFQQLKGVIKVESGYSGGNVINPTYREVCSGLTGHAEVIEITYLTSEITFEDLIKIHLTSHNPTTLHRQGADKGTQYRSIVFYRTEEEQEKALKVIDEVQNAYSDMIVTEVKKFEYFFKAEDNHQGYYNRNSEAGYCTAVINPKLAKLKELYRDKLKIS